MTSITLTILKNPFNPSDREICRLDYVPDKTIYQYIQPTFMGLAENELVVSHNGHVLEDFAEVVPEPGDYLAICPVVGKGGKKNIFATIAGIALMVWTGNLASKGFWGMKGGSFLATFSAGVVNMVGGMLINHFSPQPQPELPEISTANPSYSWGNLQSLTGQGNATALTYGTMKTAGQIISQHVTSDGDKQYLNLLLCGGEGPIDAISDIRINDNPIANYKAVGCEVRLGTNDQPIIGNFNDNFADQAINYELNCDGQWATQMTEGNGGQGLEITIELPGGLYHVNDDGNLSQATVKVLPQYRKAGEPVWKNWREGEFAINAIGLDKSTLFKRLKITNLAVGANPVVETWTITCIPTANNVTYSNTFSVVGSVSGGQPNAIMNQAYNNNHIKFTITGSCLVGCSFTITVNPLYEYTITEAKNTALRKVFRKDHLAEGQYEVRCQCTYKSGTSTRDSTRVFWTQLSHIVYDDFARPGKVLVGIRALATDQLSGGTPTVTWLQTRNTVNVWNPTSGQYEARSARNPAWAAYDMIHRCRKIKRLDNGQFSYTVFGVPVSRIEYQAFKDWADFCESKDLHFEYIFDTTTDLWSALQKPESVGRGKVIMKGTRFACVCDRPSRPVQLFTVGNILADRFQEDFLGLKERANAVEISFVNKDKGYQKDAITVYGDDWDGSQAVLNPTQITLYGCTDFRQAYREGRYRLLLNKHLIRTVSFDADIDAIACQVGDVVLVQHDVPQWGFGGRILAATESTLKLDRTVTLKPDKTYAVTVRLADDTIIERIVQGMTDAAITDTLSIMGSFEKIPQQYDVWSFGEVSKVTKPFRIVSIDRSQELRRKITALEYIEAVYNEAANIPVINYSSLDTIPPEVSNLSVAQETYRQKDGTIISAIYVGWKVQRDVNAKQYVVYYSYDDGANWIQHANTLGNSAVISHVKSQQSYLVKVCIMGSTGTISQGVVSESIYITGKDKPPGDISAIQAVQEEADRAKVRISWTAVNDIDLKGYIVWMGNQLLTPTPITDTQYLYAVKQSGSHTFAVVAVDNSGNQSIVPAAVTMDLCVEPANVAGFTAVIEETDRSKLLLSWQPNDEKDISYYEIRSGEAWDTAEIIATQLKATSFACQLMNEGSRKYMIKAVNISGFASLSPVQKNLQVILRPDAPLNLKTLQEPKDLSILKITWEPSPGKDIAGYEIRLGTNWDTAEYINFCKETTYWYSLPESGNFSIMIRAKTVAGYLSNIANIMAAVMIEPYDVTGFTAAQSLTDRTVVTLIWDLPLSLDVAYFEIRQGNSWDTGQIVGSRVTGMFYEVKVADESRYSYFIKAVSVAGKYSQNAAQVDGAFNLNPEPVTNIRISSEDNDKSIIRITWDGNGERDLACYELRCGYVWDTAVRIGETKELRWTYQLAESGDVKILIKSKNAAGFYSDEAAAHYYAILEPVDVTGFIALQNGEQIEFFWDKHPEPDAAYYEIREGAGFEQGALVATGITVNRYEVKVDVERNYHYHIKAINRCNHYSLQAVSKMVTVVNLPPKNIVETYDELVLQNGTTDNVEFGASLINWSSLGGQWKDYPTTRLSDVGGKTVLKLAKKADGQYADTGSYECKRKDMGQILTANITCDFRTTVILHGTGSVKLQIRTSQDGREWTAWQDFRPAQYAFRYIDARVLLGTTDTSKTPEVNHLAISVDVPDVETAGSVVVSAGGATINYGKNYYTLPVITPTAIGENRFAVVTTKTKTGFTVKIVDRAGNDVGGQLDWRAKGY